MNRKRERIGYVVFDGGLPLINRAKYNGALVPCRVGEAPCLFATEASAEFAIRLTKQEIEFPGDMRIIPISKPLVEYHYAPKRPQRVGKRTKR